ASSLLADSAPSLHDALPISVTPSTVRANWPRVITARSWLPGSVPADVAGLVEVRVCVQPTVVLEPATTESGSGAPQATSASAVAQASTAAARRRSAPDTFTPRVLR